jgi:hypothetical protein
MGAPQPDHTQIEQHPPERDGDAGKQDVKPDVEPELGSREKDGVG